MPVNVMFDRLCAYAAAAAACAEARPSGVRTWTMGWPLGPRTKVLRPVVAKRLSTSALISACVARGSPAASTNQGMLPDAHSSGLRRNGCAGVDDSR